MKTLFVGALLLATLGCTAPAPRLSLSRRDVCVPSNTPWTPAEEKECRKEIEAIPDLWYCAVLEEHDRTDPACPNAYAERDAMRAARRVVYDDQK
jgi:hypothetical protein